MKDRKNWSSELKMEEVSAGLETVKEQLNERVVCLHTDSRYGVPDAITSYLIQNFNDLGIKKLIITSFPIPEDAEEWTELLEGEKYVIDKVPSKLAEETDCLSIAVEHFLSNHRETFKIKDNSRQAFDRNKILNGMVRACEKRPVSMADLEAATMEIEQIIQNSLEREVSTEKIGELVMERLKPLDEVSYVRFASVYRQFKDINSFMHELNKILEEK